MENADSAELDLPYKLLASYPSGLSRAQVEVIFEESYDRIPHPDINLENSINEIWDQTIQRNASLFNAKKFRYGGHTHKTGDGSNQETCVCLHIGLTDYGTFVGTNLNPMWEKFLVASEDDSARCQHTSSPLGNTAVVETFGKKIVVLQRSNKVGEFPGHYAFPGGHPEPHEVGIANDHCGQDTIESKFLNEKASGEMFDSVIREVVEEIGVPAASLSDPIFIGISRRVLNVRPAAFFFIKCSLQSKEIQQLYSTAQDGYESTQLYTVLTDELENMASNMPGCHQVGFALYKQMVQDLKNTQWKFTVNRNFTLPSSTPSPFIVYWL